MATTTRLRGFGAAAMVAVAGTYGVMKFRDPIVISENDKGMIMDVKKRIADTNTIIPSREFQENTLIGTSIKNPLDVLVVGGGVTGCVVALDAVSRGLRVGLVEREDFSSGTYQINPWSYTTQNPLSKTLSRKNRNPLFHQEQKPRTETFFQKNLRKRLKLLKKKIEVEV